MKTAIDDDWFEPVKQRLILRREQIGMSQRAVSLAAGLDAATVNVLEKGYAKPGSGRPRHPGPVLLARWAHALRVDTSLTLRLHADEWPDDFVLDMMDHLRF